MDHSQSSSIPVDGSLVLGWVGVVSDGTGRPMFPCRLDVGVCEADRSMGYDLDVTGHATGTPCREFYTDRG